jgi:hypothetical protein
MSKTTIDQALELLATALKDFEPKPLEVDYKKIVNALPLRALSGNHINGGIIRNFESSGIKDTASSTKLTITDSQVSVENLSVSTLMGDVAVEKSLTVHGVIKAQRLEVNEVQADLRLERSTPLEFKATKDSALPGKGLLFSGQGYTKQFIFSASPDRFFSTETIDLAKDRAYFIDNVKVLDSASLGSSVQKSNLKELGRLKSLTIDGDLNISDSLHYNSNSKRLGIGTDAPNGAVSIFDNNVELILGGTKEARGIVGTFTHNDFEIVTDNLARVTVSSNGSVSFGAPSKGPTQVTVYGKLSVGVNVPDPTVDLHIAGSVKFNGNLQSSGTHSPAFGNYTPGDIVWNSAPTPGTWVGWICIGAGSPGQWRPFGQIAV